MKKIIIIWLLLPWVLLSNAQVASINNSLEEYINSENVIPKLDRNIDHKIDPESSWPETCFEDYDLWIYFDETTNEGYFTFYDPTTEKTNNGIFEGKEDYFFAPSLWLKNQGDFGFSDQSNLKIGSFIDPAHELPYFFKFSDNVGNIENSDYAFLRLTGAEYTVPCEPTGQLCTSLKSPSNNNFKFFNTLPADFIEVDFSTQPCEPIPELACDFKYNIVAEEIGGDIKLNTLNIDAQALKVLLYENAVSKIQFIVTGTKNGDSESQLVDFVDLGASNFDPINWSAVLNGFASYDEFFYQVIVHDNDGNQISCPLAIEIDPINESVYCDIFTALISSYDEANLVFSFEDPNNPDYLEDLLNDLGYTVGQAETMISSELNSADFNLSYSDGGPYYQLSENVSLYSGVDLETFEVSFDIGQVDDFSGALQIAYYATNGTENSCLISPIVIDEEEDDGGLIPELDCNSIPPDIGDMSTVLKDQVLEGDDVTINGFPLVILKITNGDNESGIFGDGIIPMPFKKKQLFVNLSGIKINEDNQVIEGQAIGKNGPGINTFPDFELPPLYIGGDICVPPPVTGPLDGSGIDPVTGLDGYGFDPETGKHHLTGTEYDPNGYDKDGNHKDTNQPWNNDNCSREGILYAENPDTGEMEPTDEKCDPTGGTPPGLQDFIDLWKPKLDDTLQLVFDNNVVKLQDDTNAKSDECTSLKQILLDDAVSIGEPLPHGENNILINEGMSEFFTHEPTPLNLPGERDEICKNTELRHIELYHCDVAYLELDAKLNQFLSYEGVLLTDIKSFVEDKIDDLKNNEFDELQTPEKFRKWLLNAILEYISQQENEDTGFIDNLEIDSNPSLLQNSAYYDALVSNDPGTMSKGSTLDALAFEYGQGFKTVMGYPREIVAETLRKYQLGSGAENIESLLPLNIDTSFNRFDISILISSVVLNPTSASMDVAAVITDTENNQKIAFGAENLVLGAGALAQESSKLMLLNEVGIRLNNAARLLLKADQGNTYIEWDCNGFAGVNIEASIQFCREYVLPLQESDMEVITDEDVLYELHFKKSFDKFFDFNFEIEAPPFELTTMRGFKWRVGAIGLDYTSSTIDGLSLDIPSEYNSKYYNQETGHLDDLWKGFYAKDIELIIPKKFTPSSSTEYYAAVKNMIIDDTGLTAHVEVGADPGILPWDEGNVNGWQMSIESMNLLILQNCLAGGGLGGKIGLAVLKDPVRYSGTFYGNNLLFSVKPDSVCNFSPLGVKIKVYNNSYVQAEFGDQGFLAKAHLNGELDFSGFGQEDEGAEGDEADMILPRLKFEGLEFMNVIVEDGSKELKFSPGRWGVMEDEDDNPDDSDPKPLISAFGISINSLSVHGNDTDDGLFLKVNAGVALIKESLTATGDIELHGKLDPDEPVFKMKYDGMKINSLLVEGEIKNILKVDGFISWYDDSKEANVYGKGFRGAVDVEMLKLFPGVGITAACQFGTVSTHDYYFVDLVADFEVALTLGPISFDKFGGGLAKGMYPNYTSVKPQPDFLAVNDFSQSPLGTTISGIKYEPNPDYGYEFKLMTGFYMAQENIFSGTGELMLRLTNTGALDEIEIRAQGQFLKAPDPYDYVDIATLGIPDAITGADELLIDASTIPKPGNDAMLSGFASFRFNFTKVEFAGKVAAYLNMPGGIIKGAGPDGALCIVDIYFGKQDWWIWVGEPKAGRRAGVLIDLAIVEAGLQAYFDIGTKIPPFPGLPFRVRHLGKDLNITESGRASSHGFAFGASFDFDFDASIAGTGLEVAIGAGFDIMLRRYEDIICTNNLDDDGDPKALGMNGWYAMGQAWAYIDGAVKILGFNIVSAGFAAVLQIQTPNPTWGLAALEVKYDVALLGSGEWQGDIEFGDRCAFEAVNSDDEFGMDIIANIDPESNQQDVGLDQSVSMNFLFPLADAIPEFQFINGETGELRFEIDQDSFGLFNDDGPIPFDVIQDKHINTLTLRPVDFFNANDSIWTIIKINILRDGEVYDSQSKVVPFKTESVLQVIPKSNVAYEYPVDGMTNFHTEQLASQQGYINLHRGQAGIFYANGYDDGEEPFEIKVKFTAANGASFLEDLVYDPMTYTIKFLMPSEKFSPSTQYKLEIVKVIEAETNQSPYGPGGREGNKASDQDSKDKVFYTSYFRTSEYTTVTDKFYALWTNSIKSGQTESTVRAETDEHNYFLNYFNLGSGEVFDYFDLITNGSGEPLVNVIVAPNLDDDRLDLPVNQPWAYYDTKGFWPQGYKFKAVKKTDYGGLVKQFNDINQSYKVDVNSFNANAFTVETGALSYGALTQNPGKLSLKVEYNFPGHGQDLAPDIVQMPLLELQFSDFYDKVIPLGSIGDYTFTFSGVIDITEEVVEKITELNND